MTGLSDFQRFDPTNNLVEPWLTHPALDVIKSWNLADKKVLEWGSGLSTAWWGDKCLHVVAIEANQTWLKEVYDLLREKNLKNVDLWFRNVNEGDQTKVDFYTDIPAYYQPDIVVVDGILRYECIQKALTLPRPLTLIVDNWQQDYVFICPAAEDLLKDFEGEIYLQKDHKDHSGRPWQTGIWKIK